jgi:hypothetical protein
MRYKNPTPNPLPASDEGAKMYLIRAETAVLFNINVGLTINLVNNRITSVFISGDSGIFLKYKLWDLK